MDFTKLVSLIDSRRLFFARADQLGDPFEGSWPKINVDTRKNLSHVPEEQRQLFETAYNNLSGFIKELPKYNAINCWHMNEHESAAMWKLYLKSDEGIAVQSTYQSLRDCIVDDERVFLGAVTYIDYDKDIIDGQNLLTPFIYKRKSFEHEREVRGVVAKFHEIPGGIPIRVDLERLIKKIYIAPSAPHWFADLVQAFIHRYNYAFEVVHSKLDEQPFF